jgi:ABC-type uncharacterized transport system auxiliary subunit
LKGSTIALAALGCALLSGCALHSDSPAIQVYVLRATTHPPSDLTPLKASIHVGRPIAGPGLESDHIVLVESGHRMSYYLASRWPADLPSVVEALTVDALRSSWSRVQDSGSSFPSDYMLQIVIRRFEADYTTSSGPPEVHVILDCTVGKRAGREVIASFMAEGSATATANRLGEVVAAFEDASNKALDEIAANSAQAVKSSQKVEAPVPSMTR